MTDDSNHPMALERALLIALLGEPKDDKFQKESGFFLWRWDREFAVLWSAHLQQWKIDVGESWQTSSWKEILTQARRRSRLQTEHRESDPSAAQP